MDSERITQVIGPDTAALLADAIGVDSRHRSVIPEPGERCAGCGSAEVKYKNYQELPLCLPCADGVPLDAVYDGTARRITPGLDACGNAVPVGKENGPIAFLKGAFSLYETPGGGILLAWRQEGGTEDQHIQVPAPVVKMAQAAQAGGGVNPLSMLKALRKGGR